MRKQFTLSCLLFVGLSVNAQIKVYTGGKVYVGGTSTTPLSLLSVGGAGSTLVQSYVYQPTIGSSYVAVKAEAATSASLTSYNAYGLLGYIPAGKQNTYGVMGNVYNATVQTSGGTSMGVYGYSGNAAVANYSICGRLDGSKNGAAVFGTVGAGGPLSQQYAGYFNGEFEVTDATPVKPGGGSWSAPSDMRVKKDITNFTDGLDIIRQIRPVNFKYNDIGGLSSAKSYVGIIAQEVNQVAPYCIGKAKIIVKDSEKSAFANDIVGTIQDSTGKSQHVVEILSYNQEGLFYAMVNSIKTLDLSITDLQKELQVVRKQSNGDELGFGATERNIKDISVILNDNISLKQENADMKKQIVDMQAQISNINSKLKFVKVKKTKRRSN